MPSILYKLSLHNAFQKPYILVLILGSLLTLIFSPFNLLFFIISFSGLLYILEYTKSGSQRFWVGFLFGFGHFLTSLYWIAYALCTDLQHFGWMIPFAVILIPFSLSCFIGTATFLSYYFKGNRVTYVIAFSLIWVLFELIRSYSILPFPWNLLGYGATSSVYFLQSAHIIGVYGMSFFLCLLGSSLYTKNIKFISFMILLFCINIIYGYIRLDNSSSIYQSDYTFKLIQPNLVEHHMGDYLKQELSFTRLINMTANSKHNSVIIWPEAAFPYLIENESPWISLISQILAKDSYLLMGCDRIERNDVEPIIYNSVLAIDSNHQIKGIYDKIIRVPFGEYIPLKIYIPKFMKNFVQKISYGMLDFSKGKKGKLINLDEKLPKILVLICYEVAFPNLISEYDLSNVGLLLNVTNDAWFGNSIGPHQQFAMARMRAVEFGIPVATAANNGISAIINSYGNIIDELSLDKQGIIEFKLPEKLYLSNFIIKFKVSTIGCFIIFVLALFFIKKQIEKSYPNL